MRILRLVLSWIQTVALEHLLRDAQAVAVVVDYEAAGAFESTDVAPQDPHAHRVKGRNPKSARARTEQLFDPIAHLAGRLVGERDSQDRLRGDTAYGDQVGDATGENPCLPAAGTGEHKQRAFGRLHGAALLGVQALENRIGEQAVSLSTG